MLNESAYGKARKEAVRCDCPFEKAILASCCRCSLARRHNIAEREAVSCDSAPAHIVCAKLHDLLREKALFALRLPHLLEKLPHAKEMKIQCGGLKGLERVVSKLEEDPALVEDVRDLVSRALENFGELDTLPYLEIVKSISAFEIRQRHQ
ncbi:MAG TPA: hypothetical protein PLK99_00325 [Burkholderiales bacterium]|nr:hypothetical protein [Burkholderiales bacterium]